MQTIAIVCLLSATMISNQLHANEDYVELKDYCGQKQDPNTIQTKKKLEKLTQERLKTGTEKSADFETSVKLKALATATASKSTKIKNLEEKNEQSQQQLSSAKPAKEYDSNTSDEQLGCCPCKSCNFLWICCNSLSPDYLY